MMQKVGHKSESQLSDSEEEKGCKWLELQDDNSIDPCEAHRLQEPGAEKTKIEDSEGIVRDQGSRKSEVSDEEMSLEEGYEEEEEEEGKEEETEVEESNDLEESGEEEQSYTEEEDESGEVESDEEESEVESSCEERDIEEEKSDEGQALRIHLSAMAMSQALPFDDVEKVFTSFIGGVQRSKVRNFLFMLGHSLSNDVCESMLSDMEDTQFASFAAHADKDKATRHLPSFNALQCRQLHGTCVSKTKCARELMPIFVFVNGSSGGNLAARWLDLQSKTYFHGLLLSNSVEAWSPSLVHASHNDVSEVNVQMMIFNMREGASGNKPGFQQLAKAASRCDTHVHVIVCGGDGTVSWVMSELAKHSVDWSHIALGVCAYGTGNDLSRVLGWGPVSAMKYPSEDHDKLRALVVDWLQAQLTPMDVWLASISTKPGGNFALAQPNGSLGLTDKDKERLDIREEQKGVKVFSKIFVNYFSLGALSQVGSTFEQKRSKSRLVNMYTYAKLGLSKAASSKTTLEIDNLTHQLHDGDECIFSSDAEQRPSDKIVSLIFMNIPSMMGGSDLWGRSASTIGKGGARFLDWVQDMGDRCIELLTFSAFKDVVKEKMGPAFHGTAHRMHGGHGPFHLQFKEQQNSDYERTMRKTGGMLHFQADGEFMAVHLPDSVKIEWCRSVSVMRALRGKHDDVLSEVLDDGARLLHFIQFLDRRGNCHAAESAYVAAMVRRSAASHGVVEVLHHIVEELLHNESLAAYLEDLSRRRKTTCGSLDPDSPKACTPTAGELPQALTCHHIVGESVDKEHGMFTFGTCLNHGLRLALETQSAILEVLGCDSGDPLSSALRDTRLTSLECVQRWCGPDADPERLQVHSVRSFDVPRVGHIWVEPCEVPFVFDDAAPDTFQRLRAMAGINEQDYASSLCHDDSSMISIETNSRSGERFFFSHDGLYSIKTISDTQADKLLSMLPGYEAHLKREPRSLLVRIVGMYRIRSARAGPAVACSGRWFIVMASIFHTSLGIHEKYDIKGSSSSNRRSKAAEAERGLPLKDLDWKDRVARDGPLHLSAEDTMWLLQQHASDTAFLESYDLFDYSILLGIHDTIRARGGQRGVGATRKSGNRGSFTATLAAAKLLKKAVARRSRQGESAELLAYPSSAADEMPAEMGGDMDNRSARSGSDEIDQALGSGCNDEIDSVTDSAAGDSTLPWERIEKIENLTPARSAPRLGEAIFSADGNQMYYIGIIDILEPFDTHRVAEEFLLRGLAQVSTWAAGHSLVNPKKYRKRQIDAFRKSLPAPAKPRKSRLSHIRSSVRSNMGRRVSNLKLPL